MGGEHTHRVGTSERALWFACVPTAGFMIAEFVGGWLSGSLALMSDASHMATDVFGISMAIVAIRFGRRPADLRRSFGYGRVEILASTANAGLLLAVGIYIIVEAWRRFTSPSDINSSAMIIIAVLGLLVNLFSMRILASGKNTSLNIRGAYLEVWSDFLSSIGVLIAGAVIYLTGLAWIDSAVAIVIGLWVFPRAWTLMSESVNMLLEGVPRDMDLYAIRSALRGVRGVVDVHDLHVWSLTSGQVCLTAHVVAPQRADNTEGLLDEVRLGLKRRFGIDHVTIQIEKKPCVDREHLHEFL